MARRRSKKREISVLWTLAILVLLAIFKPEIFSEFSGGAKGAVVKSSVSIPTPLRDEGKIRVCVWNLRSYLDTYRVKDGENRKAPKPESEKLEILETLKKINPDVLGAVEIGGKPNLLEFAGLLSSGGLNYPYMAVSDESPDYPQTAILSKIPFKKAVAAGREPFDYFGAKARSPRGVLLAEFGGGGARWRFGVLHLKSRYGAKKRDPDFSDFRVAECRVISNFLRGKIADGSAIIIGGDFNDEPGCPSIKTLEKSKLKVLPQRGKNGKPYSYFWAKKNESRQFDFFMAANFPAGLEYCAEVLPVIKSASDHAPVFVDLDFAKNN
ncbi:MAG: hypothetical protein J6P03_05210 [Opitutales bacterium]|nr:hypothetical protein [Opitutales bacterium]